jgi:hypothetical protein
LEYFAPVNKRDTLFTVNFSGFLPLEVSEYSKKYTSYLRTYVLLLEQVGQFVSVFIENRSTESLQVLPGSSFGGFLIS